MKKNNKSYKILKNKLRSWESYLKSSDDYNHYWQKRAKFHVKDITLENRSQPYFRNREK